MCSLPPSVLLAIMQLVAPPPVPEQPDEVRAAVVASLPALLHMQESLDGKDVKAEWPYEGVYRVGGAIPYGYRVGGTSIVGQALLEAPGYADDAPRREAVARACDFVCAAIREPLMSPDPEVYKGGYDVRGWGHCYGLRFLLALERRAAIPAGHEGAVGEAITFYLGALQSTEIPTIGGWNYARQPGLETPCRAASFMTAPCIFALLEARASGRAIDGGVLERGLDALERARTLSGYVDYATMRAPRDQPGQIPGAIGRMVATESALFLAGRSNCDRIAFALDSFLGDWKALEVRRRKNGTHLPPYNVAPYYFYYAFHHAALAIELLPPLRRERYRNELVSLLFQVREADGTWNDRVFERSANFGTAMTVSALLRPWAERPIGMWTTPAPAAPPKPSTRSRADA